MAANSSVEQCLTILRELDSTISEAKRAFISGDNCIINRPYTLGKIHQLHDSLPGAFNTACEYVKNITSIQQQAEQESSTLLRDSQYKANKAVEDAQKQADETIAAAEKQAEETAQKAQQEAEAMVSAARQQAQMILEQAHLEAEEMKNRENVLRRARVEASELQESTQQEMAMIRKNTFDYLDSILEQVDRGLSETLGSIRRERGDLNNHR